MLTVVSWWCFCCVQPSTLREHAVDASHEQLVSCWTAVLENHILVQFFFYLFKITVCVTPELLYLFCLPVFWLRVFLPREPVVMFAASKSQQCWQPMIEWTVQSPLSGVWDPSQEFLLLNNILASLHRLPVSGGCNLSRNVDVHTHTHTNI